MSKHYSLLSVLGIEIEYMLVEKDSLNIWPHSDRLIQALAPSFPCNEVACGDISISNELVLHVLELKNNGPKTPETPIIDHFQNAILKLQPLLTQHNVCLMPSGAHPWMNPDQETKRWPYGNHSIYQQYDFIFNCKGHGWSNLQSMHVNLPFSNDLEFSQLHNSIRLLLPLLPAIAASSPILNQQVTGFLDTRLHFYEMNQAKIPDISGSIIPEYIRSEKEYRDHILNPMYQAIAPFDPEKRLQEEWLNSRAAIPKFEYGAIEIRILDSQECVSADLSIARAIFYLLQDVIKSHHTIPAIPTACLKNLYDQTLTQGLETIFNDTSWLNFWNLPPKPMSVRDIWTQLVERIQPKLSSLEIKTLSTLLKAGNLSERILKTFDPAHSQASLKNTYGNLCQCLLKNQLFLP